MTVPEKKNIPFLLITLFLGIVIGTLYGWRTGYTDGAVSAHLPDNNFLKAYGAIRKTSNVKGRDRLIDLQAIDAANAFANGHSYSPLFYLMHPKADSGLLNVEAYWELNYEAPSAWRKRFYPLLFDIGSREEDYLKALKAKRSNEYQSILKEHRELREKKMDKADS